MKPACVVRNEIIRSLQEVCKALQKKGELLQSKLNDINAFSLSEAAKDDRSVRTVKSQDNSDKYLMKSKVNQNQSKTKV